jgi:hypothetical protein
MFRLWFVSVQVVRLVVYLLAFVATMSFLLFQDRLKVDGLASVENTSSNASSRSCRVMYQRLRATIAYVSSLCVSEVYFLIDGVILFIMID